MPQKMCLKQKAIKIKYKRMLQEIKMSYLLSIHEDSGGELHPPEAGELVSTPLQQAGCCLRNKSF